MQEPTTSELPRQRRWLAACGAWFAALGIALSAYAAHAAAGSDQVRLQTAALFAFGNGIALACLARDARSGVAGIALGALALGVLLFSGSLAASVLLHWPTTLAPAGGMLMIGGWLLYSAHLLRR